MKTQGSSPHSQVPANCPYPEPDVSLQQVESVTLRTVYRAYFVGEHILSNLSILCFE